jgi:hypothetical protein
LEYRSFLNACQIFSVIGNPLDKRVKIDLTVTFAFKLENSNRERSTGSPVTSESS